MKRNWSYETHDHGPETGIETLQAGRSRMNQTDPVNENHKVTIAMGTIRFTRKEMIILYKYFEKRENRKLFEI
jgi:hypothetical protein